jgi:hypothetical protein
VASETIVAPLPGRGVIQLDLGEAGTNLLGSPNFIYLRGEVDRIFNQWQTGRHVLQAVSREAFNSVIGPLLLSKDRKLRARFGVQGDTTIWDDWATFRVYSAEADAGQNNASSKGYTFVLELRDQLYNLSLGQKTRAWRGRISDFVTQIIAPTFDSRAIEPTSGQYALIQSYESDYEFLLRLTHLATNETGIGDYNLYAVGDTLHFHTRGWQSSGLKIMRANTDARAPLWAVNFDDQLGGQVEDGAAGIASVIYDPLDNSTQVQDTNPEVARRFSSGGYQTTTEQKIARSAHVGQNSASAELAVAQSGYNRARANVFRVVVGTSNILGVDLGDLAQLQFTAQTDALAGTYTVSRSKASFSSSSFDVALSLTRGELTAQQSASLGINDPGVTVVSNTASASGKSVDLGAAAISSVTRLSGGPAGATVPIQDP